MAVQGRIGLWTRTQDIVSQSSIAHYILWFKIFKEFWLKVAQSRNSRQLPYYNETIWLCLMKFKSIRKQRFELARTAVDLGLLVQLHLGYEL